MLIPDNIDSFESNGEKILYLKFKNDGSTKNIYVLHSLFTNYHLNNISGELDFLVLVPNEGIFAIEVKHGKVSRKDGTWYFENRFGAITAKNKSPFAQVDGSMNSIRKYILGKVEHKNKTHERFSKILWGTGIAFTSMIEFIDFGTEGHSWQILTRQGLNIPIGYYIDALSKGWHNENRGKYWYDINASRPTNEDCLMILQILRGDFDINYNEINKITDNDYLIEEFTKEQFNLLDFASYNDRCLLEGAAGTGKTLMAIEIARRQIESGKKAGLFCFNSQLGFKLSASMEKICNDKRGSYYSGTLHRFLTNCVNINPPENKEEIHKYFSEDLPLEFLIQCESIPESEKFDILILDEAQDLITPYNLEVFDLILKGGIKKGHWVFFGDFSNQAIYLNNPQETLRILIEKSNFTRFPPLKINCRNTKKIASQNTLLTGVTKPEFTSKSIDGDVITTRFPTANAQQKAIEDILKELMDDGIPMDRITLLSPKRLEKSILNNSQFMVDIGNKGLQISTIQAYKGLENTIIILFDFDEISSEESQRLLYVGISRARQKLYIVFKKSIESSYQELIQSNFLKLS